MEEIFCKKILDINPATRVEEIVSALFSPAHGGGIGKRTQRMYRQLTLLIKENPELTWTLLINLKDLDADIANQKIDYIENANDCVRKIFINLSHQRWFQSRKFRRICNTMRAWPNVNFDLLLAEPAMAFCPNSKAQSYAFILRKETSMY